MLQPKRREQLDANIKELLNNGGSNSDVEKMAQDFVSKFGNETTDVEKKNPNGTATTQKKSAELVPKNGSLGTQKYRLPNDNDFEQMQKQGVVAPDNQLPKVKESEYDLDVKGNAIKKELPLGIKELLNKNPKQKEGFYTEGERNLQKIKNQEQGYSEKLVATKDNQGKLNLTTQVTELRTPQEIDEKIAEKDLNNPNPYLYYSTYKKQPNFNVKTQQYETIQKDSFVDSKFGDEKLKSIGINPADFDGYLNKTGFKNQFIEKEQKGFFKGEGTSFDGYDIQLAEEIQKQKLLLNYIKDKNTRDYQKRLLESQKNNIGKPIGERIEDVEKQNIFNNSNIEKYFEENLPILTKKLKERGAESAAIYNKIKLKENGAWYGTKETLKAGWNGFLDRINQTSSTIYDKIGLEDTAEGIRLLNEERQILRPDNRNIAYVKGKKIQHDGVNYIVDSEGQIYDSDNKIRVTDLFFKETYDKIVDKSKKEGVEDWVFSPQGASIQTGGVLGDMIVQIVATRGVGGVLRTATATELSSISKLSKIPMSKNISSAIISQSALGYSQGLETTLKSAREAGISDKDAQMLALDAAQKMAVLYAVTAPISPQTKAIEAVFGNAEKTIIKNALLAYRESGKKGFLSSLTKGIASLPKTGLEIGEEGLKEVFQENVQQIGETEGVNKSINRDAGQKILKEEYTAQDFVNTSILSFATGGLISQLKLPNSYKNTKENQLITLKQLSDSNGKYETALDDLVKNNIVTINDAELLKKDVKAFSKNVNKIPRNINPEIALDVMRKLEIINELESEKKSLDKSFHDEIDEKIEKTREEIKNIYKSETKSNEKQTKTPITEQIVETQPQAEEQAEVTEVSSAISELEKQRDAEIEALKSKRQYDEKNITPIREKYDALIVKEKAKETEAKIKRKDLFQDGGTFSNQLGESGVDSVPTNHQEINRIEFVEFSNPNTVIVDVVMSGKSDNDYVGYYRLYENGKPTNKWSSNLKNKSRNKEDFKTMIGGVQSMLPKGHEYTEKTSISTDGLRVWEQQLSRGYEIQTYENGNIVTNEVAINGDAIVNELGIDVNQGNFDNISVTNRQQFESVKKALLPYLQKLGLNESNIRNVNGTVEIDLPVLRQKTNKEQSNNNQINNADNYLGTPTVTQTEDGDLYEFKTKDGIIAGVMVSPTEFRIDGISANEIGKGMGSKMFENLIDHLKNKGVDTITTKSAGEGAVKMHQKAVDKGLLTEVSKNGREATFNINKNESTQGENNVSDGNIQPRVEPMGEMGVEQKPTTKVVAEESVQSANDVKPIEGETARNNEFKKAIKDIPESGNIKKYLSGETIAENYGNPENAQEYDAKILVDLSKHGLEVISKAKELFGEKYIENTLEFLEDSDLNTFEKAIQYVALMNEMDMRLQADPNNLSDKKLQKLVYAKYQANARIGSLTINVGRLMSIMKYGVDPNRQAEKLLTSKQKEAKLEIEKIIQVTPEQINEFEDSANDEIEETKENLLKYTQEDFNNELRKAIQEYEKRNSESRKKTLSQSGKDVADKIRSLKLGKGQARADLSLGVYDLAIEAIAQLVEKGSTIAEAIAEVVKNKSFKGITEERLTEDILGGVSNKQKRVISEETKRKIYIKLLNKYIDALDEQIANGERNVVEKVDKYKNDTEIQNLREIKKSKQEQLAKIDPTYSQRNKLKKDLELAQKSLDEYQRRIDENDFSAKEKEKKDIDSNLENLRNKRDEKRKEYQKAKSNFEKSLKEDYKKSDEEIFNEKVQKRIEELEKRKSDLEDNIKKDNTGKNSIWTKEISDLQNQISDLKKAKKSETKSKVEKSIKDTIKELLIEAGFSREVKSKGETKVFFDWKKLAGEEGSVDKIKENVENVLKSKGYSESEIKETSKSFEDEYNRLSEEIINKGLAELENRNLIKPSPNRKLEAKRLAELYNYGLMDSESVKYDNIMNKVLGLSDLDAESYRKIKNATKALADIFNSKRTQGKLTEQAVGTLANQINHQIKVILQTQAFRNGPKRYKIASMASELAGLALNSLLQNPGNAIENVLSGVYASIVSRGIGKFKKELTPEMRKQNKLNAKIVFDDINSNAGLFYGDTNTSLISESRIEEWLNGKSDNRVYHAILSALNGRMYLKATDSMIKSDITNSYFAKNVIEILTNKSNPEGAMTREEALKYVSDNTTGVKFEEALKEAKRIVDEINSKQEEKQLADSPQAIHRFAMDIVRDNIISGGRMTQEQVEKSYIAGYKSAGRDIGHVANNWVSKFVGFLNSNLQTSLENAVKEKDWDRATLLSLTSIIIKNIMNPFVGGGTNWVVRNVTKAGLANPLSIVNIISDYAMKKEIDLSTKTGRKNLEEALYRKANLQSTTASALVGTIITMLIFAGLKANDDEGLLTLDQWLKENEWAKKYFDKLSPESATMLIALEDEKLGQHYIKSFGMKTDIFDENLILLKSLDKEDSSTLGIGASIVASPFTAPGPWRMYRDIQNIKRGLNGITPIKSDPKITGFWNGVFKGGFVDYLGYRPEAKYGTKEEIEFFRNQEKYSKEFLSTVPEKIAKKKENILKGFEGDIKKLKELKYAKEKGFKIYYKSATEPIPTSELTTKEIDNYIKRYEQAIKEVENMK